MFGRRLFGQFLLVLPISGYQFAEAQQTAPLSSIFLMAGVTEADLEGVHPGPTLGAVVRFGATRTDYPMNCSNWFVSIDGSRSSTPPSATCASSASASSP